MKGNRARREHRATAAAQEIEQPSVGDGDAGEQGQGKERRREPRGGERDGGHADKREQRAQSLAAADVERVGQGSVRVNEAGPGNRAAEDLGVQQVANRQTLRWVACSAGTISMAQPSLRIRQPSSMSSIEGCG